VLFPGRSSQKAPDSNNLSLYRHRDKVICFFDFELKDGHYVGEDYLFCDRAREQGFEVWIDPTIKLGHMGVHEFEGSFGEEFLYPLIRPVDSKKEAA
jgi:hypothetical protein